MLNMRIANSARQHHSSVAHKLGEHFRQIAIKVCQQASISNNCLKEI